METWRRRRPFPQASTSRRTALSFRPSLGRQLLWLSRLLPLKRRRRKREVCGSRGLLGALVAGRLPEITSRYAGHGASHGVDAAADSRLRFIDRVLVVLDPLHDDVHGVRDCISSGPLGRDLLVERVELLREEL